ncbi:MAG: protein-glutamate O-methyltransferase CheR [Bacteroidia bacterium]
MSYHPSQMLKDEDVTSLINSIYTTYGYDFADYSEASFKRRINRIMIANKVSDFFELQHRVVNNELFFNYFLEEVTVNVTEMFRDVGFYKTLRKEILPQLSSYPTIRIWHAGCSTGEEVYSMAILLKEAGLLDRSLLYATDINQKVLEHAASGKYSIELLKGFTTSYIASGGLNDFSNYYTAKYGKVLFDEELRKKMVFSVHNLVTDQSFNEFNLILCRNVMIYFNRILQNRVLKLFTNSLAPFGFLALGSKETIDFSTVVNDFEKVNQKQKIWRKTK